MKLLSKAKSNPQKKHFGQGMTEYIVIVALIAVAAIAAYSFFGKTLRTQVAGLANELSGTSADTDIANAVDAAGKASVTANEHTHMGTYDSTATSAIEAED